MLRKSVVLLTFATLAIPASSIETTNRLLFPISGFSIVPLEQPLGDVPQMPLTMAFPAIDGFAANVNVQIQPYVGTLDDYIGLTETQFKAAGVTLMERKKMNDLSVVFEYAGVLQGRALHWYARAVRAPGKVYLVTATGTEAHWVKQSTLLKSCVDSFRPDTGDR